MVLDFINHYITDRGYPPTLREIGSHMGIRSTNGVKDHLYALERKGYIERDERTARAIRLVPGRRREGGANGQSFEITPTRVEAGQ